MYLKIWGNHFLTTTELKFGEIMIDNLKNAGGSFFFMVSK